jgi:hypothetical protein
VIWPHKSCQCVHYVFYICDPHTQHVAAVVAYRWSKVPSFYDMICPCSSDAWFIIDVNFGVWWHNGRAVVIKGSLDSCGLMHSCCKIFNMMRLYGRSLSQRLSGKSRFVVLSLEMICLLKVHLVHSDALN